MGGLIVDRLVPLVIADPAPERRVSEAPAVLGGFLGRPADAGCPADQHAAGSELVTAWAPAWLSFEQRNVGHGVGVPAVRVAHTGAAAPGFRFQGGGPSPGR